jgi:hypothetical protein
MLPIFNSSCNESGKVSDPSYSNWAIRETSIPREDVIGTTPYRRFRSDLQPLQWDTASSRCLVAFKNIHHTSHFNFNNRLRLISKWQGEAKMLHSLHWPVFRSDLSSLRPLGMESAKSGSAGEPSFSLCKCSVFSSDKGCFLAIRFSQSSLAWSECSPLFELISRAIHAKNLSNRWRLGSF